MKKSMSWMVTMVVGVVLMFVAIVAGVLCFAATYDLLFTASSTLETVSFATLAVTSYWVVRWTMNAAAKVAEMLEA